ISEPSGSGGDAPWLECPDGDLGSVLLADLWQEVRDSGMFDGAPEDPLESIMPFSPCSPLLKRLRRRIAETPEGDIAEIGGQDRVRVKAETPDQTMVGRKNRKMENSKARGRGCGPMGEGEGEGIVRELCSPSEPGSYFDWTGHRPDTPTGGGLGTGPEVLTPPGRVKTIAGRFGRHDLEGLLRTPRDKMIGGWGRGEGGASGPVRRGTGERIVRKGSRATKKKCDLVTPKQDCGVVEGGESTGAGVAEEEVGPSGGHAGWEGVHGGAWSHPSALRFDWEEHDGGECMGEDASGVQMFPQMGMAHQGLGDEGLEPMVDVSNLPLPFCPDDVLKGGGETGLAGGGLTEPVLGQPVFGGILGSPQAGIELETAIGDILAAFEHMSPIKGEADEENNQGGSNYAFACGAVSMDTGDTDGRAAFGEDGGEEVVSPERRRKASRTSRSTGSKGTGRSKGLKQISLKLMAALEAHHGGCCNSVADDLILEMASSTGGKEEKTAKGGKGSKGERGGRVGSGEPNSDCDNLRRRVYDVLNVFDALGLVRKDGRRIYWEGKPLDGDPRAVQLKREKCEMEEVVKQKKSELADLVDQYTALYGIATRNAEAPIESCPPDKRLLALPFVIIQAPSDGPVDIKIADDLKRVTMGCMDGQFVIHDDMWVLKNMATRNLPNWMQPGD
ncbi:unnamed protein product, partial [Ostreobium quekettii]